MLRKSVKLGSRLVLVSQRQDLIRTRQQTSHIVPDRDKSLTKGFIYSVEMPVDLSLDCFPRIG